MEYFVYQKHHRYNLRFNNKPGSVRGFVEVISVRERLRVALTRSTQGLIKRPLCIYPNCFVFIFMSRALKNHKMELLFGTINKNIILT